MKSILTVLFLLLVSACGAPRECDGADVDGVMCTERLTREYVIDPSFTPEQQEIIMQAGDDWRVATAGRVALRFAVGTPANITPEVSPDHVGYHINGTVRLAPDLSGAKLRNVVAHELGHSLALGHSTSRDELMWLEALGGTVTPADVAHFDRLYAERAP